MYSSIYKLVRGTAVVLYHETLYADETHIIIIVDNYEHLLHISQ